MPMKFDYLAVNGECNDFAGPEHPVAYLDFSTLEKIETCVEQAKSILGSIVCDEPRPFMLSYSLYDQVVIVKDVPFSDISTGMIEASEDELLDGSLDDDSVVLQVDRWDATIVFEDDDGWESRFVLGFEQIKDALVEMRGEEVADGC